jgi:CTP:molybdopterin cytidylyltransferase MocA
VSDEQPVSLAAIILSGGESTRMGKPKALLDFGRKPAITRILETARKAGISKILVVVGKHAEAIQKAADLAGCTILVNENPERGQLSSIQLGMSKLDFATDAAFVWPVDCPLVRPDDLKALAQAYTKGRTSLMRIFVPCHGGHRGHPMLVDTGFRQPFMELKNGQTARNVIEANPTQVMEVSVSNTGVLLDIDTPDDYQVAVKVWESMKG